MTTQTTTNEIAPRTLPKAYMVRLVAEFGKLAKEAVTVKVGPQDKGTATVNAFGSELAALRLYAAYEGKGRVAYSENLKSWYYQHALVGFSEIEGGQAW